ncbi:unnamed protein product [Clavelina lepadiformis]|uniref:Claudin n=1 Tax=Clavelina lepadiformis TaxID=159417 RepID=A0ABP0FJK1_CLALP
MTSMKAPVIITAACLVLVLSGLVLVCLCTFLPYWQVLEPVIEEAEIIGPIKASMQRNNGLWKRCVTYSDTGTHFCDDYDDFFLGLPAILQLARYLSIISMASAITSVAATISGLLFRVLCLRKDWMCLKILMVISLMANFLSALVSAGTILYAVTIYDNQITKDNQAYLPFSAGPIYERGSCIYYGWIGGGFLICGAIMSLIAVMVGIVALYQKQKSTYTAVRRNPPSL